MTHPVSGQLGPTRLLDDVRSEAKPTAQSILWCPEGDEMFLEIEWICDGEQRFDRYLSSNVDMRYVHLVESSAIEPEEEPRSA